VSEVWEGMWERIEELSAVRRVLVLVAVVVLLVGGFTYFLYLPRQAEIAKLEKRAEEIATQRNQISARLGNVEALRAEVRELKARFARAQAQLPDKKEIPELLSQISSAGRQSGLEILRFKQLPEEYADFYAAVPVEIVVRGNYFQVAKFFDRVAKLDRIVNVSDIVISEPEQVGNDISVETRCRATTFRFLDEGERKKVAEEKKKKGKKK